MRENKVRVRDARVVFMSLYLYLALAGVCNGCCDWDKSVALVNYYRKLHGAAPVAIAANLNFVAQDWADQMAEYRLWEHSGVPYGENIAGGWSPSKADFDKSDKNTFALSAIDLWYEEVALYNFSSPGWSPITGHFTQLVWKDTKEIGIGVAYNEESLAVYVVMNYWPSGNWPKGFVVNVSPRPSPSPPIKVMGLGGVKKNNNKWKSPPPPKGKGKNKGRLLRGSMNSK